MVLETSLSGPGVASAPGGRGRGRAGYAPAALIAASFAPVLVLFGAALWSRPHYRFSPLLAIGAAALAWRSCRGLGPLGAGAAGPSRGAAALAWLLLAAGVALLSPWLAAVGALVGALGAAYASGGRRLALAALPAWALLWLAVPPPGRVDEQAVDRLGDVVSRCASVTLDVMKVYHTADGRVLRADGRGPSAGGSYGGPCLPLALPAATLLYAFWVRASAVRAAVLVVASVFWGLVGDAAQVVAALASGARWGVDVATGWGHALLALAVVAVALVMVVSTDRLLAFAWAVAALAVRAATPKGRRGLKRESRAGASPPSANRLVLRGGRRKARREPPGDEPAGPPAPAPAPAPEAAPDRTVLADPGRTWVGSWPAAAAFAALLVPQAMMPRVDWGGLLVGRGSPTRFAALGAGDLPDRVGPLARSDFKAETRGRDDARGENSRVWLYRGAGHVAAVSLDYPFVGWHDPAAGYRGRGWRQVSQGFEAVPPPPVGGGGGPAGPDRVVTAQFVNPLGRFAYLAYALYDRDGRPLDPPGTAVTLRGLRGRLASWVSPRAEGGAGGEVPSYQLQVFYDGDVLPDPADQRLLLTLFAAARRRVGGPELRRDPGVTP